MKLYVLSSLLYLSHTKLNEHEVAYIVVLGIPHRKLIREHPKSHTTDTTCFYSHTQNFKSFHRLGVKIIAAKLGKTEWQTDRHTKLFHYIHSLNEGIIWEANWKHKWKVNQWRKHEEIVIQQKSIYRQTI